MSWFHSSGIKIAGITAAVPKNSMSREDFLDRFSEEEINKFVKTTGIEGFHKSKKEQTASDLGFSAADNLLNRLKIDRSKIGVLVFVTLSPDYRRPATSCVLQMRLKLSKDCTALDVCHGCSGFVYGQQTLESLMMASEAEYGLLIVGETPSKVISQKDHSSMMLGDAGAAILYKKDGASTHFSILKTDGEHFKTIILPAGGFRDMDTPKDDVLCADGVERSKYDIYMDGTEVFTFSITEVPKSIKEFLERTNTTIEDYDTVILHQANLFIIKQLRKKFRIPEEKTPLSLDRYGNTSSASIPLTLCDRYGQDQTGRTLRVLAAGFGVGLSWGITSFEINTDRVFPIVETEDFFSEGIIDITKL